ncbi:hypothetical protein BDV10DRAFT_189076 [Aspergillus recurvatus]
MIPEALQPKALLVHPRALAAHLRSLAAADTSIENLTFTNKCILDQVHTEAVPSSVYGVWLPLTCQYSLHFTAAALTDPSRGVRDAARQIVRRRLFRGSRWKERGWDVLGGAQGIKDILDGLPLTEVRLVLKVIFGRCYSALDRKSVSSCVEEFLELVEDTDPWTSRSLLSRVSFLYAYCSAEKVEDLLRSQSRELSMLLDHIAQFHTPLLRRIAVGTVHMPKNVRLKILQQCRRALLSSKETYDTVYYQDMQAAMPPGLLFGMDFLMAMEKEPKALSNHDLEQWVEAVAKKGICQQLPFRSILLILNQGLAALQISANTRLGGSSGWLSRSISHDVVQFWSVSRFGGRGRSYPKSLAARYWKKRRTKILSVHQDDLQQCLIGKVLQIKDKSFSAQKASRQSSRALTDLLNLVNKKGRLEFLQLLCRHSPTLHFDLTTWPPSQKEQERMPCWDLNVLKMLRPEDSKLLFNRSLYIHHCEEFLPISDDRYPGLKIPTWEAQCQLWATWESAGLNGKGFPVVRKALDEMRRKSMRAREPVERLRWAKSAVELAAITSSVDIFAEVVEWSKRFIRDALVFPDLIREIIGHYDRMLSCRVAAQGEASVSKPDLMQEAQKGHGILEDLLKTCLLLLREPWARPLMSRMTRGVRYMLSTIVGRRMDVVRKRTRGDSVTEPELTEILLDPMIPILIEYERQGNTKGQTDVDWSGPSGMILSSNWLPETPNLVELSFIDRLAVARDGLWQRQRAQNDPNILNLSPGLPRGLAIQHLVHYSDWLYQAMRHPDHAPFLSSRANKVLFSAADTVMAAITSERGHVGVLVDDLAFIVRALLKSEKQADRIRDVLRVWEYYSQILQPHPLYLGLFQDWLVDMIRYQEDMAEATTAVRPPSLPVKPGVSAVPAASETGLIEWDPHGGNYPEAVLHDNEGIPDKIPCTILNCRMAARIPSGASFVCASKPRPNPEPITIWSPALCSPAESQDSTHCAQGSVILAALLFLDTYTETPGILRTKFPAVDFPRYPPMRLADRFVAFQATKRPEGALGPPIAALRRSARRVPPQILRDLIWSFLDTLKAEPNAPTYSALLFSTFDLIEILLSTDKPQLAIDVVIRVWKDFPKESSFHRKISLVKLGRILTPEQGRGLMSRFAEYVCYALQAQQSQSQGQKNSQQEIKNETKGFIKVTTAKMLAQTLAEADFLSQSDKMDMLQRMFSSARHIDIRSAIVAALLELVSNSENTEPYKVFASIASSVVGPNERAITTEAEWEMAEDLEQRGPLPYVAPLSERPVLNSAVSTAFGSIPARFRSDYVQNVLLPLLQESSRQHMRWMAAMAARLGLSLSDLNITEYEIGPFTPDLADKILWSWAEYLPGSYLQEYHRPWALSYLHHDAFTLIDKALAKTADRPLKDIQVREHWTSFLASLRARPAIFSLDRLLPPIINNGSKALNGLSTAQILEDFEFRAGIITQNPIKYNGSLQKYIVCPEYSLEPLQALRKSREVSGSSVEDAAYKARIYNDLTDAMTRVIDICENVRNEGWSIAGYPVTLPSPFEYHVLLLPSLKYTPAATESKPAVEIFTSAVVDLITEYSADPTLLLKLDSLQPVMREVSSETLKACTLRLGSGVREMEKNDPIVICVRVKLARLLLDRMRSNGTVLGRGVDVDLLEEMVEEWKKSNVEFVRQVGWEVALR